MLAKILGPGWLGIVVASLIAAYMSTIGTHLNWGSSYVVNDFYKRFVKKNASEKDMVRMGRICTVLLMVFAGFLSLTILDSAQKGFELLFLSGAGKDTEKSLQNASLRLPPNEHISTSTLAIRNLDGILCLSFLVE